MDDDHVILANSCRSAKKGATRVGEVDPSSRVEVTLTLRGREELPELDPREPAMSREELESGYGASGEDLQTAQRTLERYGLTVEETSALTRSMRVSGTAAQMEEAFHPGMAIYRSDELGEYRGREGELQIPKELDGIVTGVFGFDQRRVARRVGIPAAASAQEEAPEEEPAQEESGEQEPAPVEEPVEEPAQEEPADEPATGLSPSDLVGRYSFPPGNAAGQKVAILEFGGAYSEGDLKTFCGQHGVEPRQPTIVGKPLTQQEIAQLPQQQREAEEDASGEVMMDIEIVTALCQGAEVFVYFSSFEQKGWIDVLNQLISGQPASVHAVSISWGIWETTGENSEEMSRAALEEINQRLEAAAHLGITVCAAAGDDGSGDQVGDGDCHVNFPASSPFVLSVGGTMLTKGGNEVVWRVPPGRRTPQGGGATGGGVSVIFPRPAWQTVKVESLNNDKGFDGRIIPDIAALAGPPGYDVVLAGKREPNGGTSAATPLWASLIARMLANGKPTNGPAFLAPLLYENGTTGKPRGEEGCTDITKGNNTSEPQPNRGYEAGPGYDAVSGWGVPNGQRLLAALP